MYLWGFGKKTTINQETNTYYYHTDQLRSTRLVTDSNKNIITAILYNPYGETNTEEGIEEDYLFTGKQEDSTGLYYFMGRYYDPGVGRFLTRDSEFGQTNRPQTLNKYTYVLENPLKFVDPDGSECTSILVEESRNASPCRPPFPGAGISAKEFVFLLALLAGIISAGLIICVFLGVLAGELSPCYHL